MTFEKKLNKTDYENDWALDVEDNPIHITRASSGAQGYYCLGCGEEMQAYKSDIRKSFFRHDARNINKEKVECVIASKLYRERLAETILNRIKFVKTPALYKYPPKGIDGVPMLLQKSKIITANYTKAQEWFYEDKNGYIKNGKNPDVDKRYLLIRPDVTFFDAKDKPILFIEFVITHKLDEEKITKLSRLGIDTLQIIIPKVPEEQIEQVLKSSRKYKWVYNELEANSTYISIPQGNTEGIPPIDEEQRRLFEESYNCRAAKINNLVRNINKCIRSESYRRIERLFNSEISRVEKNTKSAQQRLEDLEKQYRAEAFSRNFNIEEKLRIEEKSLTAILKQQNKDMLTWKKDILTKIENLNKVCEITSVPKILEYQLNLILKEKEKWSGNFKETPIKLKNELENDILESSKILTQKSSSLTANREILKKQFDGKLNLKLDQLKKESEVLENSKKMWRMKFRQSLEQKSNLRIQKSEDLKKKKENLRAKLEKSFIENSMNPPENYPEELKPYWKQKEWEALLPMLNAKKHAIKGHENYLKKELRKQGKSLEWFMESCKDEIETS